MTADKSPVKPGKDVVYVDLDDEITSIIDKVENTKDKVVALVLPKRAAVLQSIVNMRLLKRAADNAGKNVVLISSDSALSPLAGAAGLHVAKSLASKPHIPPSPIPIHEGPQQLVPSAAEVAQDLEEEIDATNAKIDYGRSIGELAAGREVEEPETIPLNDDDAAEDKAASVAVPAKAKVPKDKKLKVPNFDKFRVLLGLGILAFIGLIVFIILAIFVLPKAKITIKTVSLPVSANFNLTADGDAKTLDEAKGIIPASLPTKDQTATTAVNATGKQNNGDKASGSVTLKAEACNVTNPFDPPAKLAAGSGITAKGLTFITQNDTAFTTTGALPSGLNCYSYPSIGSTSIKAQVGGSNYNMPTGTTFSVPSRSISGNGSTSGGTDNIATILSQSDVDGAKSKITSADTDKFSKDWQKLLDEQGLYLITSTLKLSDPAVTSSVAVGQPTPNANVTVKITYTILAVKKDDLKKAITGQMSKQIDTKKQKLASDDPLKGLTVSVSSQESPTKAILQLRVDTTAVPILDIEGIKKASAGQKSGAIQKALGSLPGVKEVDAKFSPFWVSKAPKASKITVVQQQVSSGNPSR